MSRRAFRFPRGGWGGRIRRWSRILHRDLSYLLSALILIYAISGIYMNHRDRINPHYSITRHEYQIPLSALPSRATVTPETLSPLLSQLDIEGTYLRHYYPSSETLKIFLRGGSTLEINTSTGVAIYESIHRRPLVSSMVRLHYNPGTWWTIIADILAGGLIVLTLSGWIMIKGRRGLWGRGGILLMVGLIAPLFFLFL